MTITKLKKALYSAGLLTFPWKRNQRKSGVLTVHIEMLQDSFFDMRSYLTEQFAKRLVNRVDQTFRHVKKRVKSGMPNKNQKRK